MTAQPGADELRIRSILRQRQVGPDAIDSSPAPPKPAVPPMPRQRPRDWLDDILDTPAAPEQEVEEEPAEAPPTDEPEPAAEKPARKQAGKPRKPKDKGRPKKPRRPHRPGTPAAPRAAWDSPPADPRQSLAEAWDRVPYRLKWLAYHATAAAVGWRFGWVAWSTKTAAWFAAGRWTTGSAWVLYGLAVVLIALYRRTRAWAWPAAWAAAIPVSSVVVGVLLYGTSA